MREELDVTRVVRSWLEEGTDRLPDRVLDAVLDAVPTTPQHRSQWSVRRFSDMPNLFRAAMLAAAVLVAAVAGIYLLPHPGGVGGPGPSPTPSPSPTRTPIPLASSDLNRPLTADTYRVGSPFAAPFTITFTSDWTFKSLLAGDTGFVRSTPATGAAWLNVDQVDGLYADPCHTEDGPMASATTSSVAGVVDALTHMVGFDAGPVTDVKVGGHPAKQFVLTNAINTDTAGCSGGPMLWLWHFKGGQDGAGTNGGATEHIWIVDVNGTVIAIDGETFPTTPASQIPEIETVVQSIVFE